MCEPHTAVFTQKNRAHTPLCVASMPAEVNEKPDLEEPSAQDTKEQTDETAETPSSDASNPASSNHTETHTESSGFGTEKSSSPDSKSNSSSNEQVVPNLLKEASSEGLEESQTPHPDVQCPDQAPPPDSSGEKDDTHTARPPHPDPGVTSDPPNEIPTDPPSLYGTLNAQAVTLLHGLPFFPGRTFLPENCYTLPLHREGFARAASKPEPDTVHHMRPALDLTTHTYLQDLYRAQTLIPQKRASMVSLDTIRKDPRWRDPNLREVISMLSHPMDPVKSNAAAYLQHLCYENDTVKQDIRQLRGIPVLVGLLDHPKAEVHRKACGALRNISFGRDNFSKVAIKNSDGIPALLRLLRRSDDLEVRERNCSRIMLRSCVCRNVSSDGAEARQRLRECDGLVDALLHALYSAVAKRDINNKSVENCVCILRNLSYHVHKEVPGAEKFHIQAANHSAKSGGHHKKKDEPERFGGLTTKGKQHGAGEKKSSGVDLCRRSLPMKGLELLYQPEVVRLYLSLLKLSQNHNTLEAAAGALQNLSAGHWAWSNYIRATVRKEKGLPVLVELLHSGADKVVRAIAIALRNLAIDHKNKDLIGSYAMRDLVSNLTCGQQRPAKNLEGDTVVAVLNTILEIVSENLENARFLIQGQGIQKLVSISRTSQSVRETKAASHLLQTVWAYKDLRHTLYKAGWNKTHFKPAVSGLPKKQRNAKQRNDDITLPLMEKSQDGYCTVDQAERAADAPCHMIERETFQGVNDKRHFIRTSRPAVGLVERTPQPLDSWV
ncbi:armadillo repeat protein deleted in velo-cardio-facial syndrome [Sinocyclocheilus rhinocerous]|uniref:armadillo repeat protein deleted in velo-cardio-facial syndrome n=1 Tax=Sinocyclocheilus rhinocerous TaxID=307959 RepID=UPI0007BA5647|nr:PREDICTED: armadillo repeat protein deleted in velo-cardio-facial syndrome-like [Sinocyclocheilus rhinocerous]